MIISNKHLLRFYLCMKIYIIILGIFIRLHLYLELYNLTLNENDKGWLLT